MNTRVRKIAIALIIAAPLALWGFSSGPVIRRTGAPVDEGGATCTACHRGNDLNSPGGFVRIEAVPYRPGEKQTVRVTVSHPEAQRWGFQLTARLASDATQKAGAFTVIPNGPLKVRCAPAGRDATLTEPCGNEVEFIEHGGTPDSTFGGSNGTKTFELEWTAPEGANVGDVVFYAAGNAANGNNTNTGDRIYNTSLRIQAENTCNYIVTPRVQGMGNAGTSRAGVSMNTILSIYGANFVPSGVTGTASSGFIRDNRFPAELGCVAVEIAGQRVPILYVQQDQLNVQVPTIAQTGTVPVKVIINPGRPSERSVDAGTLTLQNYSPAFFTFNGTSIAARIAGTATPAADASVAPTGRPAAPGEVVELYATGLGPSDPVYQAGELVPAREIPLRERVTVSVGGTALAASDILYAGIAPGSISGFYQLNLRIPTTAGDGDLPVIVTVGGVSSPAGTTIPVRRR
jgi:uncharacterized protein (TIGR03437 family)